MIAELLTALFLCSNWLKIRSLTYLKGAKSNRECLHEMNTDGLSQEMPFRLELEWVRYLYAWKDLEEPSHTRILKSVGKGTTDKTETSKASGEAPLVAEISLELNN